MATSYEEHLQWVKSRQTALQETLKGLFDEPARLSLEIGCGHGHWLVGFAAANPKKQCMGLDIIGDRIERANRKKSRAGLENVTFVRAEAMETLDLLPEQVELDEVFVLFPDPWPKKRHWKNRLFCERFLVELSERCKPGTRCYFRTDHGGYFEWAEEVVEQQELWKRELNFDWPFEEETVFQAKADSYQSLVLVKR